MSIDYSARIVVGLRSKDLGLKYDQIEELGLSITSPYFDAPLSDSLVGIVLDSGDYDFCEIDLSEITEFAEQAKITFFEKTGLVPTVFLSTRSL